MKAILASADGGFGAVMGVMDVWIPKLKAAWEKRQETVTPRPEPEIQAPRRRREITGKLVAGGGGPPPAGTATDILPPDPPAPSGFFCAVCYYCEAEVEIRGLWLCPCCALDMGAEAVR
jgi:hypothetical protein